VAAARAPASFGGEQVGMEGSEEEGESKRANGTCLRLK
jgi:hypothetical protein